MSTGTRSGATVEAHLQDVPLDDDRWENPAARFHTHRRGVWELLTGSEMLPRYPGARMNSWEVPGTPGERRAMHMPVEARTIPIRVKFWPVCTDPANPMYQREGRDAQERYGFLAQNMREFIFRTQVGKQLSGGNLKLTRALSAGEHFLSGGGATGGVESCVGAFAADWDQNVAEGANYAVITALFRNPTGTWYTDWRYTGRTNLGANYRYQILVPMGDAPVQDCLVAINVDSPSGKHLITNEFGAGFRTADIVANRWHMYNCANSEWSMGSAPSRWWSTPKPNRAAMFSHGPRMGSALSIQPGKDGDGRRVGRVNVLLKSPGSVSVAVRPNWF